MKYLLDSGFLYAVLNDRETDHAAAKTVIDSLTGGVVFPVPAITEVAYLVHRDLGAIAHADFLANLPNYEFLLESPSIPDIERASQVIRKYKDQKIDFVDALIVAMAERLNITKILTVDRRHFQIFRPVHCEAFEIFP